jgi:hypothetical protein
MGGDEALHFADRIRRIATMYDRVAVRAYGSEIPNGIYGIIGADLGKLQ